MLKIGDFSKKTGASIRTLRYYDSIDLFKPKEIDLYTGYRYYTEEQIEDYQLLCLLKDAGFTLEEIKKYWNSFSDRIMLEKKQELLKQIGDVREKIRKVDYLRSNLNEGKIMLNKKPKLAKARQKSLFN